ncbi:MAG TPA: DUF1648 domain-containing protein [Terriglobales bacterium]|jgi:hypothetical protein|nr:DUF1648 domain-containing protein [Terriglobales bacterium]
MDRRAFQILTWLTWLTLPLVALRYWQVWDQLPLRMATHFNANSQPNGWMSREASLWFGLGITAFLLVIFTGVLLVRYSIKTPDAASWALLALFYFVLGIVSFGNHAVIEYNLHGTPVQLGMILFLTPLAIVILIAVVLGTRRGRPLATQTWLAQETHASPLLAMVFLLPLFVELWVLSTTHLGSIRLGLALLCLLFLMIAIFAGSGFRYYFGSTGVEIRTLGYRLRSIPTSQITSYAIEPWNILRGYGIRGIGDTRAYVWCNKVVHIKTPQGEVFLGHTAPERIIRDLDMIKKQ